MRIGLGHIKLKMFTKRYSVEKLRDLASKAGGADVDLLCISPLINVEDLVEHYDEFRLKSVIRSYAEKIPSSVTDPLLEVAEENGLYVVAGGLLERAGPKLFITSVVISPLGKILTKYRKITVTAKEVKAGISSGGRVASFKVKKWKIGITQDFDIFVPEIYKNLNLAGTNIVLNLTKKKLKNSKEVELLKSAAIIRAFENNCISIICGVTVERYNYPIYSTPTLLAYPGGSLEVYGGGDETLIVRDLENYPRSRIENLDFNVPQKILTRMYKGMFKKMKG